MNEKENPEIEPLEDEQAKEATGGKLQQFPRLNVPITEEPIPIRRMPAGKTQTAKNGKPSL